MNAVFKSLEVTEDGRALKMCLIPIMIKSIHFYPWFSFCVCSWFPSSFTISLHPLSFSPLALYPPPFSLPIHIYNTSKPIWEEWASLSVGKGILKCFLPSNLKKLQHVKPETHSLLCATLGSEMSNMWKPNHLGNPVIIITTLVQFWWLRHVDLCYFCTPDKKIFQSEAVQLPLKHEAIKWLTLEC